MPDQPSGAEPSLALAVRRLVLDGNRFHGALARELGLGPSDLNALGYLYLQGPLTPRELNRVMEMTSGTVTALLDRLEQAGFVARTVNPRDRRSVHVALTPAGQRASHWVHDSFQTALTNAVPEIPDLSIEQITSVVTALARALAGESTRPGTSDER